MESGQENPTSLLTIHCPLSRCRHGRRDRAIRIPDDELEWSYARSGGPGGQNVNKVASKAVLRWKAARVGGADPAAASGADAAAFPEPVHDRRRRGHPVAEVPRPGAQPPGLPGEAGRDDPRRAGRADAAEEPRSRPRGRSGGGSRTSSGSRRRSSAAARAGEDD